MNPIIIEAFTTPGFFDSWGPTVLAALSAVSFLAIPVMLVRSYASKKRDAEWVSPFSGDRWLSTLFVPVLFGFMMAIFAALSVVASVDVSHGEQRKEMWETISVDSGLEDLHAHGFGISGCEPDSPYDAATYSWRVPGDDELITGTLEKSAEEGGSCTYTFHPGEITA